MDVGKVRTISAHFSEITLGIGGGRYVRISSFLCN